MRTSIKLAAALKWILITAALLAVALVFIAKGTAHMREQTRRNITALMADDSADAPFKLLREENERLKSELRKVPELTAAAGRMRKQLLAPATNDSAWTVKTNAIHFAIEQKKNELAELSRWQHERQTAEQQEAARARLVEKAQEAQIDHDEPYAKLKETLSKLALARKRIIDLRQDWGQLPNAEQKNRQPLLQEARAEWMSANERLGKDNVLYQALPITDLSQDAATAVFMRSVLPDRNGMSVTVYLDGTVKFSQDEEAK